MSPSIAVYFLTPVPADTSISTIPSVPRTTCLTPSEYFLGPRRTNDSSTYRLSHALLLPFTGTSTGHHPCLHFGPVPRVHGSSLGCKASNLSMVRWIFVNVSDDEDGGASSGCGPWL
jgi:hypothetical protein